MAKKRVAFICVHNSCRSQMAEALAIHFGSSVLEAYSAGTELRPEINQDAVRLIKEIYGIDMEESQSPKLIDELPAIDYLITMGCNVTCPILPYKYHTEDWGLEDPSGKPDTEFVKVIKQIETHVKDLIHRIEST